MFLVSETYIIKEVELIRKYLIIFELFKIRVFISKKTGHSYVIFFFVHNALLIIFKRGRIKNFFYESFLLK